MGDYNYSSPSVLGMQFAPSEQRSMTCSSNRGAFMRFKSNTTNTPANVHIYVDSISGSPGVGIEITSAAPDDSTTTDYTFYPGTDTGSTTTNLLDQGGATVNYSDVDNTTGTSTYAKQTNTATATLTFRGNDATGVPAGQRIVAVVQEAYVAWSARPGSGEATSSVKIANRLNLSGTNYDGGTTTWTNSTATPQWITVDTWYLNPSTNSIWTRAEVNNLVTTAATDEWGLRLTSFTHPSGGPEFRIYGIRLKIQTATDYRMGYYVNSAASLSLGWNEFALSGGAALSNNTYYYLTVWNPASSGYFTMPTVWQSDADTPTAVGDTGIDHRRCHRCYVRRSGGLTSPPAYSSGIECLPVLLEIGAGTINSQSNPYVYLDPAGWVLYGGGNLGQQITTPGSTVSISGVRLIVGWQGATPPDAPLIVQVRYGVGKESGGGSLDATATLTPAMAPTSGWNRYTIPLNAAFTPSTATQYALYITTTATSGKGWKLMVGFTDSTHLTGTTQAEVEGAGQGGTTDSYFNTGTTYTAYDHIGAVLMAGPTAPASFTATAAGGS